MKKINLFKISIIILSMLFIIQCSIINVINKKNAKIIEVKEIQNKKINYSKKNSILKFLNLGGSFQILKIEKDANEVWTAYLHINGDLKGNLEKIDFLTKSNFKIINYNAEFKDKLGSINLEVQVGD